MHINGMGLVSAQGAGTGLFEQALRGQWRPPTPSAEGGTALSYRVDMAGVKDKTVLKRLRRADKLSRMSVLAASEALAGGGEEHLDTRRIGVIVATACGPHVTTFRFLDDIMDYGEGGVSPTTFSNSVHNAAASYIAETFGIQGPTLTVTQFFHSFHNALLLAGLWLGEGRCDHVLVGAVEQWGEVLEYVQNTKLPPADGGMIRPFRLSSVGQVPGEGAAFFLLGRYGSGNSFCRLDGVGHGDYEEGKPGPDVRIIDADGLLLDESVYEEALPPEIPAAAYSPLFGSMMTGSAFNCAAGALMLRNQMCYANPVPDNPHGLHIVEETALAHIEIISCTRYNCNNEKMTIRLARGETLLPK